jgi:REP element-mobilizing transposase RayT
MGQGPDNRSFEPQRYHRASIRLRGYDYTRSGKYFVTVCTHQRACWLADVSGGLVVLSALGRIVEQVWRHLPRHFPGIELDCLVVMPNHLHCILVLAGRPGAGSPVKRGSHNQDNHPRGTASGSVAAVVQNAKSIAARRVNDARAAPGAPVWQRNYYERIIRDDAELSRIRRYIEENPARWAFDGHHPLHRLHRRW